jgi:hypothetical protein
MTNYRKRNYEHILELNRSSYRLSADRKETRAIKAAIARESIAFEYYNSVKVWRLNNKERVKEYKRIDYHRNRQRAYKMIGGCCQVCQSRDRLEFHHLYYGLDSRDSKQLIHLEVFKHPERFQLLCRTCHSIVTLVQSDPRGLEKARLVLERLINTVQEVKKRGDCL